MDFDDLIIDATKCLKENNKINYKYIIIDEYQDISLIRLNLIKEAANKAKIIVVGDDWQSIYSFSGSNINLFYNFRSEMEAKTLFIQNTYRNSQTLINIAGDFIMKDESLIKKNLKSYKEIINPILLVYYKNFIDDLEKIINNIIAEDGINTKILILGRYNADINKIKSYKFKINNSKITYIYNRKINITFLTIHASKGLGFDNVIIINFEKGEYGFPSSKKIDKFKKHYFKFNKNINEERRVFYVALTRTKKKVYLLVNKKNESCFIKEIKKEVKQLKI
jgi:DNA helicase-4